MESSAQTGIRSPARNAPTPMTNITEAMSPETHTVRPPLARGRPKAQCCAFGDDAMINAVFGRGRWERLMTLGTFNDETITLQNFPRHTGWLSRTKVIVSTWGMPFLNDEIFAAMPELRILFYAGGSVRAFCQPFLDRDIVVVSSWRANAIPVAEFTLGQILLSNKGYFRDNRCYTSPSRADFKGVGNFGETVALLGAGAVGRHLIALLKAFRLRIIVFDPFLANAEARALGVERVTLSEAFAQGSVVSNHLADVPETVGLIDRPLFLSMKAQATFINTGRGATVKEPGMIAALRSRPDINCLLDVSHPEPPVATSPLFRLPNVFLSRHLAGSNGNEIHRMADICIEEFAAWNRGEPLTHTVSGEMLHTMA